MYIDNPWDGSDTINEAGGNNTIRLGPGLTPANVTFNTSGYDLLIGYGTAGDQIRIVWQYYNSSHQVQTLVYGEGRSIRLSGGLPIVGGEGNVVLNGKPCDDNLIGGSGTDRLNVNGGMQALMSGIVYAVVQD